MSRRKPLEPGCDGSVWCPVAGHVTGRSANGSTTYSHFRLTSGQYKTLREHPALVVTPNPFHTTNDDPKGQA